MNKILSIILNEPGSEFFPAPPKNPQEEWTKLCDEVVTHIEKNPEQLLIIVGGLGYGKSCFISSVLDRLAEKREKLRFRRISFVSCSKINDAYMHIISPKFRLIGIGFVIFACAVVAKYFPATTSWIEFLIGIAILLFFFSAYRLTYIFLSFLSWLLDAIRGSELVVLEDLERGALSIGDRFLLLANRWIPGKMYLAAYGFENESEYKAALDFGRKLNARVMELPVTIKHLHAIAKELDPVFPFKDAHWLLHFTPRTLLGLIHEAMRVGAANQEREILYYQLMYHSLKRKLAVVDDIEFGLDQQNGGIKAFKSSSENTASATFESFAKSIDWQRMMEIIESIVPAEELKESKRKAGNWSDQYIRDLIIGRNSFSNTGFKIISPFC